jgi:hypothetical protein
LEGIEGPLSELTRCAQAGVSAVDTALPGADPKNEEKLNAACRIFEQAMEE